MDKIEIKNCAVSNMEVKKDGEHLYIEGYALCYGNKDSYDDIIEKGALEEYLNDSEEVKRLKLCYQHNFNQPIGAIESLTDDNIGLKFRAKISNTTLGKDVATLIEDGVLDEFSIGYRVKNYTYDTETGIRHLTAIKLYEISPVTRAANPQAKLTDNERKEDGAKPEKKVTELTDEELEKKYLELKGERNRRSFNRIFNN